LDEWHHAAKVGSNGVKNRMRSVAAVGTIASLAVLTGTASGGVGDDYPSEDLGDASGLNYRSITFSPFYSEDIDLFADCDPSAAVVGGGVTLSGQAEQGRAAYGFPDVNPGNPQWRAAGFQVGSQHHRLITAFAVCIKAGSDDAGVTYETTTVPSVSTDQEFQAKADCPGGSSVAGGGSDVYRGTVPTSVPFDDEDANTRPDDGWKIVGRSTETSPTDLTAYAICLGAGQKIAYRSSRARVTAHNSKSVTTTCKGSESVISGGVSISGPVATRFVHSTLPRDSSADGNKVPDDMWQATVVNNGGSRAGVTVYALCLSGPS
jgi:hypothetical protein